MKRLMRWIRAVSIRLDWGGAARRVSNNWKAKFMKSSGNSSIIRPKSKHKSSTEATLKDQYKKTSKNKNKNPNRTSNNPSQNNPPWPNKTSTKFLNSSWGTVTTKLTENPNKHNRTRIRQNMFLRRKAPHKRNSTMGCSLLSKSRLKGTVRASDIQKSLWGLVWWIWII